MQLGPSTRNRNSIISVSNVPRFVMCSGAMQRFDRGSILKDFEPDMARLATCGSAASRDYTDYSSQMGESTPVRFLSLALSFPKREIWFTNLSHWHAAGTDPTTFSNSIPSSLP